MYFRGERDATRVHVVSTPTPLKLQILLAGLPLYLEEHPAVSRRVWRYGGVTCH